MERRDNLYGRRKGKPLSPRRLALMATVYPTLAVDVATAGPGDLRTIFPSPVSDIRLEIGFGGGEHLIAVATERNDLGFIGVEPFVNGMAKVVASVADRDLRNIRLFDGDAVRLLDWLPPAYESTEVAGAGDQAAGALGVGIVEPGPVSVVLGTSGVVFAVLPAYKPDAQARVHVFCHAVPGTWHAMGVMLSAAGSLAWLSRAVGASYGELDEEAARWSPGTEGLLFAPYLAGERTPHADPDARGAFTGLSLRHDRGALARATLEGVAYGLRDSLELLRELGVRPEVGRASGGGATSDLWLRIVASVLALPLERTESEEGAAFGAALLAGVRCGVFADAADAVARCVRVRDRIDPDPEWSAVYERGYERYRLLYPNLRQLEEPK